MKIEIGSLIRCPSPSGGFRVWKVIGVFHGGESQESVLELETIDQIQNTEGRVLVPVDLMSSATEGYEQK